MKNDKPPILVFGATGRQGGSVAMALLREGWPVRALVRDPLAPASVALRNAGLEVMTGSFQDNHAMLAAMKDTYGIFSVLPANLAADDEIHYGMCVADLAAESGVAHFVYSSGASVGDVLTGVPRFDAKPRVEAHIRQLPITATIIRPMIFMEMLVRPGLGLHEGRLVSLINPENSIQLIAVEDIGKFVAAIFADPIKFSGVTLKIACERQSYWPRPRSRLHRSSRPPHILRTLFRRRSRSQYRSCSYGLEPRERAAGGTGRSECDA